MLVRIAWRLADSDFLIVGTLRIFYANKPRPRGGVFLSLLLAVSGPSFHPISATYWYFDIGTQTNNKTCGLLR